MLLAQLSDLHIRPQGEKLYDFIDTNTLCARHVAKINNLEQRPDAVVITGDITNCGLAEEYKMAERIISVLDYPTYIIPGNHDNNENFLKYFGDTFPYLGKDPDVINYLIDDFPIRLIFIDTSVDGELYGRIGQQTFEWLGEILQLHPLKETMLFMHHHPLKTGCLHMDEIFCHNGEDLIRMLDDFPQVSRIVCGHTHRTIFHQTESLLISTAPSAVHQVPFNTTDPTGFYSLEPPSMLMHRYDVATGLVSYVESLAVYDGPFRFDVACSCPEND